MEDVLSEWTNARVSWQRRTGVGGSTILNEPIIRWRHLPVQEKLGMEAARNNGSYVSTRSIVRATVIRI
ncbi:hypothetical protein ZHAS_00001449 [Anopheles sinensis]|uniref:Uncharacterized protein n=1 Tax=Anopheles sinensis TaxID=74873 RepID=A0A084VBD0_ANOSI|nr:hypothetical protein ZHAS_00001449 [Anopheles sinensis]